jgi:hypothetical protein
MSDEIQITVPAERAFGAVAGLVVGGLAARHALTIDVLDDLQLALESLLRHERDEERQVTIVLRVGDAVIDAAVGPFERETVSELEAEAGAELGLRRLLETVVDDVSVAQRDGSSWVELRKGYLLAEAS